MRVNSAEAKLTRRDAGGSSPPFVTPIGTSSVDQLAKVASSMRILFANRKLQRACESSAELERRFGSRLGRVLGNRLTELAAAPTLAGAIAVPHLKLHQLWADRDEQFSMTLVEPRRLILEVAHDPVPRDADGGIDLASVTEILIIEVVDYH